MIPKKLKRGGDARENWKTINDLIDETATLRKDVTVLKQQVVELQKPGFRRRGDQAGRWV